MVDKGALKKIASFLTSKATTMNKPSRFLLAALAATILPSAVMAAEAPQRPLRVALYPYVPDIGVFKDVLTNTWSRTGRPEGMEFISWDCYNDDFPTNADVVVSECGFLESYVAEKRLRPLDEPPFRDAKARYDIFIDFAKRDAAYADFLRDASLPGGRREQRPRGAQDGLPAARKGVTEQPHTEARLRRVAAAGA